VLNELRAMRSDGYLQPGVNCTMRQDVLARRPPAPARRREKPGRGEDEVA
jgi:hypothetical protein